MILDRSILHPHVLECLALRAALGKSVEGIRTFLKDFEHFVLEEGVRTLHELDAAVIARWLTRRSSGISPRTRNKALLAVRVLFRHLVRRGLCTTDHSRFVPPASEERVVPRIFSPDEIERILLAIAGLRGPRFSPYKTVLYQTLVFLLYAAGLRVSEALRLLVRHIDVEQGTLRIEETKFGKSRLIPLSEPALRILRRFLEVRRQRLGPPSPEDPVFLAGRCRAPSRITVGLRFRHLLRRLGIYRPRVRKDGAVYLSASLHSLRHSFAVHRLHQWYRQGEDVLSKLPLLSTWLGHVEISSTQHYLTVLPDLLREAGRRFAGLCDDGSFLEP
jgi:site-specific recombinase XerD